MKRLFAIVFLVIYLFNWGGYLLLQNYLVARADRHMNDLISQNLYDPNSLIEVKVKLNLPGIFEWPDYKNVTGQLQLKNACYNYVKLKFTKDTLYVLCVPNYEKTKLVKSNIIYVKELNDIPTEKKGNNSLTKKGGHDNYDHLTLQINFDIARNHDTALTLYHKIRIKHPLISLPGQPPEFFS